MKARGFVPALALGAALLAPPLAEAAHRHGPGCGHGRYAPRYSQSYRYGRGYHQRDGYRPYGYSRPAPYYYGGGYYGSPYPVPGYYGYYGYDYGYYPPPPPPRYYRRPHVGIGFYLRF